MKKLFQKLKKQSAKVPRTAEEIVKIYYEYRARSGDLQYNIFALELELQQINETLKALNYEMAERQNLDKATAAETAKVEAAKVPTPPIPAEKVQ